MYIWVCIILFEFNFMACFLFQPFLINLVEYVKYLHGSKLKSCSRWIQGAPLLFQVSTPCAPAPYGLFSLHFFGGNKHPRATHGLWHFAVFAVKVKQAVTHTGAGRPLSSWLPGGCPLGGSWIPSSHPTGVLPGFWKYARLQDKPVQMPAHSWGHSLWGEFLAVQPRPQCVMP